MDHGKALVARDTTTSAIVFQMIKELVNEALHKLV
jgi:hypothetical protein